MKHSARYLRLTDEDAERFFIEHDLVGTMENAKAAIVVELTKEKSAHCTAFTKVDIRDEPGIPGKIAMICIQVDASHTATFTVFVFQDFSNPGVASECKTMLSLMQKKLQTAYGGVDAEVHVEQAPPTVNRLPAT